MLSKTFTDFDAFVETVHDVDCSMLLQNPQRHVWSINHVHLPKIHIQLGRLGSGNIVEGQSIPNGYLIYLPLSDKCEYLANGKVVDHFSFVVMEPGCEFCISTQVEHDWCSIFIPSILFEHSGKILESLPDFNKMTCRVTQSNHKLTEQFLHVLQQIITAADNSQFESSPAATCAEAELLKLVSLIVGQRLKAEPHLTGRPKVSRQEIIRRSKVFFNKTDREPFHVIDMAQAIGVSERTLRTTFNEYYGIGPARYKQLRDFYLVRQALLAADPGQVTVTDVLIRLGQWEFGRFSGRYRKLYGELPSETLRKKR